MRYIGNVVYSQGYQGFESLRLRHKNQTPLCGCFIFVPKSKCGRSVRNLRLQGSGRQLMKTSHLAQFESYAAKGALLRQCGAKGNQTIPSTPPERKIKTVRMDGFYFSGRIRRDTPERSDWRIRRYTIRKNKQSLTKSK